MFDTLFNAQSIFLRESQLKRAYWEKEKLCDFHVNLFLSYMYLMSIEKSHQTSRTDTTESRRRGTHTCGRRRGRDGEGGGGREGGGRECDRGGVYEGGQLSNQPEACVRQFNQHS